MILRITAVTQKSFLGVILGEADTTGAENTDVNALIVIAHDAVRTLLLVRWQMALTLFRCLGFGLLLFLLQKKRVHMQEKDDRRELDNRYFGQKAET